MLGIDIFNQATTDEKDLFPLQNPDVIACQVACDDAQLAAEPARNAWKAYVAAHYDDSIRVPWPKNKAQLADADHEAQLVVDSAAAALDRALTMAIERATAAWDDRIRQAFREDLPVIEHFIEVLEKHEAMVVEAQAAGVSHVLKVPVVFITSSEIIGRLDYAKRALGLT